MQSGGELFEGEQQALVERATWQQVQRMLDGREKVVGTRGLNPAYVLRGLLRCGACGEAMTPGSTRRGQKEYRYYRCTTRDKQGKEACSVTALPARAIEEYVVARIIDATGDGTLVAGAKATLEQYLRVRRERLKRRRAELPTTRGTRTTMRRDKPNPKELMDIVIRVYGKYPIPQLIGIEP